jgi:hypothetical protein
MGRTCGLGSNPDLGHANMLLAASGTRHRQPGAGRARRLLPARPCQPGHLRADGGAADIPPVRITSADLTYSTDARAGQAKAVFTPNPEDTTSAFVIITYANGVRENIGMTNMVAMGGPSGWRMNIGIAISPGSSGPPPTAASPSP